MYLSRGISRFNNARQSGGIPRPSVLCIRTGALVGSARLSMPINNNHLYRILITRSKQTNKRREMRRAVREEVGLMLWWLRADLRSVGPPTSKMYLRAEYRSTCYECFNATVHPFSSFFFFPVLFHFATVAYPSSVEKNFDTARTCRECRATSDYARES